MTGTFSGGNRAAPLPGSVSGEAQGSVAQVKAMQGKGKAGSARMVEDTEALDLAADWADISQGLRKDLGQQLHSQWIRPIQLGSFCKETGTLDLYLPTDFSANWVADRFADRLSLAWKIARPDVRNVHLSTSLPN